MGRSINSISNKAKKNNLMYFFLVVSIFLPVFSSQLFFSIAGLIGLDYEGSEQSSIFVVYLALQFSLAVILFLLYAYFATLILVQLYFILFFILFLALSLIFSVVGEYEFLNKELAIFLILGFPGVLIGLIYYKNFPGLYFYENFKYFILILSYVFLITVVRMFLDATTFADIVLAGASYQFISYTACLLFGLLLYFFYLDNFQSGRKVSCLINFFYIPALISLPVAIFITGSKGATLLFMIYSVFFSFAFSFKRKKTFLLMMMALLSVLFFYFGYVHDDQNNIAGLERILVLFDSESSFDQKSSGRSIYYENFIILIRSSPLFGYGTFVDSDFVTNSHNFFSMVILNFGVALGSLFLLFNLYLVVFFFKKADFSNALHGIPAVLFLFLLVYLSFSGSYLKTPIYWFVLSVMFCVVFRRARNF